MNPHRPTLHTRTRRRSAVLVRRVVGTPAEVAATIALVRDSGRLLSSTPPHAIPGTGKVTVTVRFLDTSVVAPVPTRRSRRGHLVAAVIVIVVVLFGVGCLVAQLADAVGSAVPLVVGIVLVLSALLLPSRKATSRQARCSTCHD